MGEIKIVGMDPSLRNWGVVRASLDVNTMEISVENMSIIQPAKEDPLSVKTVRKNSDDLRRSKWLYERMIDQCKGASIAIAEVPVGSQSSRAMASYGICIGLLSTIQIPLIQVTPNEVKLASVGKKTATKNEMIDWSYKKHPEADWKTRKSKGEVVLINDNEHLADAVAAIYAGISTDQFRSAISMIKSMAA